MPRDTRAASRDQGHSSPVSERTGRVSFSASDFAAADRMVDEIAADMAMLLPQGVERLRALWEARDDRLSVEGLKDFRASAHDLAGYGATLGYPMVTRLSRSVCRFIEASDLDKPGAVDIIGAHVAALHVVIRDRLTADGGPMGKALVDGLTRAMAKFRAK
jgi:hypothetical protein